MKAAKDREDEFCDLVRKDNILGRNQTRLELREEHHKDPPSPRWTKLPATVRVQAWCQSYGANVCVKRFGPVCTCGIVCV